MSVESLLSDGGLRIEFQPIFSCGGGRPRLFAVEALTRGRRESHFADPAVLFDYIRLKRAEVAADRSCVAAALQQAEYLPLHVVVSMNVHARTLEHDQGFPAFLLEHALTSGIDPKRIVLEMVEQGRYWNRAKLMHTLHILRSHGIRLALDDLGAGTCNYGTILDTRPDYLKIDAYIVQGCADDPYRRRMLDSIRGLAADFDCSVVAEGIERKADFEAVVGLGIDLVQGFLLGRPSPLHDLFRHFNLEGDPDVTKESPAGQRLEHHPDDGAPDSEQGSV